MFDRRQALNLRIWPITLALLLVSALVGTDASGMMESDKFVGAWRLVSAEFHAVNGELVESPYGNSPQGILVYDAIGTMSMQLAQKDRKPFVIADRMKGTSEEIAAAFESYQAYWGRYTIDERERVVTHHVTHALLPNWAGTEQRRHYKFQDFKLHLRTPPLTIGGRRVTGVLIWEKIKLNRD